MMIYRWVYNESPSPTVVEKLAKALAIDATLAYILAQRGIDSFEKAKQFFRPTIADLYNPFLMRDMDKAVDRLIHAISSNEKILIYGDYDVDGTTSVSMVYGFLSTFYGNLEYYIPDRYTEGYGISKAGIDFAKSIDVSLIISLDCGIKSHDKISYAKSLQIDFIVCDHHLPDENLPPAIAVLDPKRKDCEYPFKELCGCGVGFKFMQAFCIKRGIPEEKIFPYLDLVAIATCADIVPLIQENRTLVFLGLAYLNKNNRPGIKALTDVSGFKKLNDVTQIVFGLGPRINAAGRITHAKFAVELLLAKTENTAIELAQVVNEKNTTRKDYDSTITEEALKQIKNRELLNNKSTVLYDENWHKGVIGIVASRCIEKHYKPTIILTKSGDHAVGSARSVEGFDIHEAISSCGDLLEQYGGHKYAAGLTLKLENLEKFCFAFEQTVQKTILPDQLDPIIKIDKNIGLDEITPKFYRIIKQMAPFGPQNMQPIFTLENISSPISLKLLKDQHLKFTLKASRGNTFDAIGFSMPQYFERIKKGDKFNLCFSIAENEFKGTTTLQLLIRDIKFN